MRGWFAVLFVAMALAGCAEDAPEAVPLPELTTEPPAPENATHVMPTLVTGVITYNNATVTNASVYIERDDLTQPINNIGSYIAQRDATIQQASGGTFIFEWTPEDRRIAVRAPGMKPWLSENLTVENGTLHAVKVVLEPMGPTVTAHRGGASYAPANTLSALHKAGLLGIPRAEIDIHWTSDEVFVLFHDGFVDDPSGERMWTLPSDEVTSRDVGSDFHESFANETIPTLAEALELMRHYGTVPVVEVKITDDPRHPAMMAAAMEEITEAGFAEIAIIISFDPTYAIQCGQGGLLCGYIEGNPEGVRTDPGGAGKDIMNQFIVEHHMPKELASESYVQESHDAGLLVTAWTVNDVDESIALIGVGVDMITTDIPWHVMQAL